MYSRSGKSKDYPEKECEFCGKTYKKKRDWQRFCTQICQWRNWDKLHPRKMESVA